jgi:predicted RNA-binding Zn-ribbon protein involved in translation (DUF1610 family)
LSLRKYECPTCGFVKKTFKKDPICEHIGKNANVYCNPTKMEIVLEAPQAKFMEPSCPESKARGKSKVKGLAKVLKERARSHSRETMLDDLIQKAPDQAAAQGAGWVNSRGRRRTLIEDK